MCITLEEKLQFRSSTRLLPLLPIAAYLLLAAQYLNRPGLYYDELFWLNAAVGIPVDGLFCPLRIGPIPVMVMNYIGALKSWVYAIPLAIFGTSAVAIRSISLALGCCVLFLLWKYLRQYFSPTWATMVCAAVAVDPSFVYTTRCDWGPVTLMLICKLLTLMAFTKYLENGKPLYLYLCGAALVLGTYDKANFSWFYITFLACAVLVYGKTLLQHGQAAPQKTIRAYVLLGIGTLAMGLFYLFPLYFSSNGSFEFHISFVWTTLRSTLEGNGVYNFIFGSDITRRTWLYPVFVMALILCPGLSMISLRLKKQEKLARFGLFHTLNTVLLIFCMACTSQFGGAHHIMMIYPAPELLFGTCCVLAIGLLPEKKLRFTQAACGVLLIAIALSSLVATQEYLSTLRTNDTYKPTWDPKIEKLGNVVNSYDYDCLVTTDWGLANQMVAAGNGNAQRSKIHDIWPTFNDYSGDETSSRWLQETFFDGKRTIVLLYTEDRAGFPDTYTHFQQFLRDADLMPSEVQTINGSDGQGLYKIYYFEGK